LEISRLITFNKYQPHLTYLRLSKVTSVKRICSEFELGGVC